MEREVDGDPGVDLPDCPGLADVALDEVAERDAVPVLVVAVDAVVRVEALGEQRRDLAVVPDEGVAQRVVVSLLLVAVGGDEGEGLPVLA